MKIELLLLFVLSALGPALLFQKTSTDHSCIFVQRYRTDDAPGSRLFNSKQYISYFVTSSGNTRDGVLTDPCEQAKPAMEKVTAFAKTAVYTAALAAIRDSALLDPVHEHTVAFGKDQDGNIFVSSISTGGKSSSRVPAVARAFADLHSHPKNTPPSSGDVYGLIRNNIRNALYEFRFVTTPGGTVYALVITDAAAAKLFVDKYPSQQTPGYSPLFPDALLNEYRDIIYKYGAKEEWAMAYILEKYDAGVSLLKQFENGDFKKLRTSVSVSGSQMVFSPNNCP